MLEKGHDIRFCTSHLFAYDYCVVEKYEWIDHHFGSEFVDRIILTRDKTLIRGDLLIDDKPEVFGLMEPTWEHIVYDRPHNRRITDKRRITWTDNWQDVVFAGVKA
jgi:5'-nucleotidase